MTVLPQLVTEIVDLLSALPGVEAAGLNDLQALFAEIPTERKRLVVAWVDVVADRLGVPRNEPSRGG